MPKNVRERDQIWNCPTNPVASGDDGRPPALASADTGANVPAPFPGLVTKFLDKGDPYVPPPPDPPEPPDPPIPPDPPDPSNPTDPPPEFEDGYYEVFHTYFPGGAKTSGFDGGWNWEPGSEWSADESYEDTVVFGDSFVNATGSLAGHVPDFGSGGAAWT